MKSMKYSRAGNICVSLVLFCMIVFMASCGRTGGTTKVYKNLFSDEKSEVAERDHVNDFTSPQIADPSIRIAEIKENIIWYTSNPKTFGSSRAKSGGVFHTFMTEFPPTFRSVGPESNHAMRDIISNNIPLIDVNPETKEWMPAAATHWAFSQDGKTVYFMLNEGMKWSDGVPVTADDYVFMYSMMRSPNIQDPWYNEYFTTQITSIKKINDKVIAVTLNETMAPDDLLYNASVTPRPSHFYQDKPIPQNYIETYNWNPEPVTGPYYLSEFTKGESMLFKKVSSWWGYAYEYNKYRFNAEEVEYKVITGGNDVVREYFFRGALDTFYMIIPQEWIDAQSKPAVTNGYIDRYYYFYIPLDGLRGVFLNIKTLPLNDRDVRIGVLYALNMQKMIDTVLRGEYYRYNNIGIGHVFAGITFDDDSIQYPNFDPKIAAQYFDKAGFSIIGNDGIRQNAKGQKLSLEMLYSSPNHTERLAILQQEAKLAGLNIELKLMQSGSFTLVREKKYQAWWGGMSTSLYPDYWEYLHSSNANKPQTNNFFGYASKEMDELLDAVRAEKSLEKKAELTKLIQKKVLEEALVVPSYTVPYIRIGAWKWIRFPSWISFKYWSDFSDPITNGYMWIDESIKTEVEQAMSASFVFDPQIYLNDTYKKN